MWPGQKQAVSEEKLRHLWLHQGHPGGGAGRQRGADGVGARSSEDGLGAAQEPPSPLPPDCGVSGLELSRGTGGTDVLNSLVFGFLFSFGCRGLNPPPRTCQLQLVQLS